MARKTGKDRDSQAALLTAAWDLFMEVGSEAASVDAIVARAGLSKGTFFHFFPTKMDMLEALCERIAEESWRTVGPLLEAPDRDPLQRLESWLQGSRNWRLQRPRGVGALWSEATRDQNAVLLKKIRELNARILAPALSRVIVDGNAAGQFSVRDPEITAGIVIDLGMAAASENLRLLGSDPGATTLDLVVRRANATIDAIERVLGAPDGALHRVRSEELQGFADRLSGSSDADRDAVSRASRPRRRHRTGTRPAVAGNRARREVSDERDSSARTGRRGRH
jgi:AcrR family transcriptional regulator